MIGKIMRLALFQPDIPGNAGAIMRTAVCLGVSIDIIGPCGFVLSDKQLRRAGMDYLEQLDLTNHSSWPAFKRSHSIGNRINNSKSRLVLLSTKAENRYLDFSYFKDDILLVGQESAGVPQEIHASADASVRIPMRQNIRSLNVTAALTMVLGEALRQTNGFSNE
jgi:tRNA (cytidine/uridine-2'-O-)-methyltransferase